MNTLTLSDLDLTVMPEALEALRESRNQMDIGPEKALRLFVESGGCCGGGGYGMAFDAPRPEYDCTLRVQDLDIIIDELLVDDFRGAIIGYHPVYGFSLSTPSSGGCCGGGGCGSGSCGSGACGSKEGCCNTSADAEAPQSCSTGVTQASSPKPCCHE